MLKIEQTQAILKKASIKVHPDKNNKCDFKRRYLAKSVFAFLK
jgi:hypothetical protein